LIDCRVEIQSRLGLGTRVSIFVPLANEQAEDDVVDVTPKAAYNQTGLIFLIDDEAAIREAMTTLVEGWGHRVIAAESGARMLELAAECPACPDLVVVDFRLRDGENGVELIKRIQIEYNKDIPGILMTGDNGPSSLREARDSGFLMLHKPISSGKLRAAIQWSLKPAEIDARFAAETSGV
jgi:CheY-like chemotaxis protein